MATGATEALVEREALLARIERRLEAAAAGQGAAVLIRGAPGEGKTAFLTAVNERAQSRGYRVLSARSVALEAKLPYGLARELLGPLRELQPGSGFERAGSDLLGHTSTDRPLATLDILHGLYWLLADEAVRQPVVLLVDDIHWADRASIQWLAHMSRRMGDLAVLLIGTLRASELAPSPAERDLSPVVDEELHLLPLTPEGVRQLAAQLAGSPVDDREYERLLQLSRGNPLLLTGLALPGASAPAAGERRIDGSLRRWVQLRLGEFDPSTVALAEVIAVLGRDARLGTVASVASEPPEDVELGLDRLRDAGFLVDDAAPRFAQGFVERAVYDGLGTGRRSMLHRRSARALFEAGDAERAALHITSAEPGGEAFAVIALMKAARRMSARGEFGAAAALLRRALVEPPAADHRAAVLRELGLTLMHVQPADAVVAFAEAEVLGSEVDPADKAHALVAAGRTSDALAALEDALNDSDGAPAEALEAQLLATEQLASPGQRRHAARIADQIASRGETLGTRLLAAHVATTRLADGEPAQEIERMLRDALRDDWLLQEATQSSITPVYALNALARLGRVEEAIAGLEYHVDFHRARGSVTQLALCLSFLSRMRRAAGRVHEAHVDATTAVAATEPLQAADGAWQVARASLALTLVDRGAPEEAISLLARTAPESSSFFARDQARSRAIARLAAGDPLGAVSDIELVVPVADREGPVADAWDWRSEAVEAHVAAGQLEAARDIALAELRWAQRIGAPWREGRGLRLLAALEDRDTQSELLRQAVELLLGSEWVLERARAQLELGASLRRAGLRREAREHLRAALDTAVRGGAHVLAQRARDEMAASGARLRRELLAGVDALTPAERRVAREATTGATNREIAQSLFLSTKTIESHLRSIFRKLEVNSRHQLAESLAEAPERGDNPS